MLGNLKIGSEFYQTDSMLEGVVSIAADQLGYDNPFLLHDLNLFRWSRGSLINHILEGRFPQVLNLHASTYRTLQGQFMSTTYVCCMTFFCYKSALLSDADSNL